MSLCFLYNMDQPIVRFKSQLKKATAGVLQCLDGVGGSGRHRAATSQCSCDLAMRGLVQRRPFFNGFVEGNFDKPLLF